jgi:hypothetical protein
MSNQVIGHVEIPVTNIDDSAGFYNKLFGWELKQFGNGYFIFNTHKGMTIGLRKVDKVDYGNCTIFHVNVEDIDSTLKKVVELNGKVHREKTIIPVFGYYALIKDPDGNTLGLYQGNY